MFFLKFFFNFYMYVDLLSEHVAMVGECRVKPQWDVLYSCWRCYLPTSVTSSQQFLRSMHYDQDATLWTCHVLSNVENLQNSPMEPWAFFKASALWADAFIESRCQYIYLSVSCLSPFHVIFLRPLIDTWHMKCDISHALTVCDSWYFEDLEEKAHWLTDSLNQSTTRLMHFAQKTHIIKCKGKNPFSKTWC